MLVGLSYAGAVGEGCCSSLSLVVLLPPRALSLWGLLAVTLTLPATLLSILGYGTSVLYYPYAPFEFAIGIGIMFKGAK